MPSHLARSIYDATTTGDVAGAIVNDNEGLGNEAANLIFDLAAPYGMTKGLNLANKAVDYAKLTKELRVPKIEAMEPNLFAPRVSRITQPNGTLRLRLDSHTQAQPREFVLKPVKDNNYQFHQRIWDGEKVPGTLTPQEKQVLFQSTLDELPEGATILPTQSTPDYLATVGTVKGRKILNKMAKADGRFTLGEPQTFQYEENGVIKDWATPSITKNVTPNISNITEYVFGSKLIPDPTQKIITYLHKIS